MGILEATDRADDLHLYVERQAGGDPVRVEFRAVSPSGSTKIWCRLVGKAGDLFLDPTGSSSGPIPSITPGVHGAAIQVVADASWVCSLVWVT